MNKTFCDYCERELPRGAPFQITKTVPSFAADLCSEKCIRMFADSGVIEESWHPKPFTAY